MSRSPSPGSQQKKNASHVESILAKIDDGKSDSRYRRDDVIYAQGEPAAFVFYIRAGKLKMTVLSEEGKEAVVAILPPGNFCGEECLIGHRQHLATAKALTDCELVRMPKASIVRALHDDPEFSRLFTTYLVERSIRVQEDLVDQLLSSTEKRLARLLLILANYGKEDRPEPIVPKINQETLAEMIGTTRTHVNLFMNKFRQLGFIQYNGDIRVHKSLLKCFCTKSRKSHPSPARGKKELMADTDFLPIGSISQAPIHVRSSAPTGESSSGPIPA